MTDWKIITEKAASAAVNMERDAELLASLDTKTSPILHLYEWERDAATYGHFIQPEDHLIDTTCLDLARRPTGGGIVLHTSDLAFSVLIPASHPAFSVNTLDNYRWVNEHVLTVVERLIEERKGELLSVDPQSTEAASHFCMAKPTIYDVMIGGRKVGGAAQRRTKHGFLHQGTISLAPPSLSLLSRILKPGTGVLEAMQHHTFSLCSEGELEKVRRRACDHLTQVFTQ